MPSFFSYYTPLHHPGMEKEECYSKLAMLFGHAIEEEWVIGTVALDYNFDHPAADWSWIEIGDAFVSETTVDGAHGASPGTLNVVSAADFHDSGGVFFLSGYGAWGSGAYVYSGKTATSLTGAISMPATLGGEAVLAPLQTTAVGAHAADSATINVVSTHMFPSSGSIKVRDESSGYEDNECTYTGKTATSFTGCGSHPAFNNGRWVLGKPPLNMHEAEHVGLYSPRIVT